MRIRILAIGASAGACALLSGCSAGIQEEGSARDLDFPTTGTSSGSDTTPVSGGVLTITLPSDTEQDCAGRDVEITGSGRGDLELNGQCGTVTIDAEDSEIEIDAAESVTVSGAGNRIQVDTVGVLTVTGSNNDIEYDQGTAGPDPEITDSGSSNRIYRDDSPEDY